jgi:hypothetical protein
MGCEDVPELAILRYILLALRGWAMVGSMTKLRGNPWAVLVAVSLD